MKKQFLFLFYFFTNITVFIVFRGISKFMIYKTLNFANLIWSTVIKLGHGMIY